MRATARTRTPRNVRALCALLACGALVGLWAGAAVAADVATVTAVSGKDASGPDGTVGARSGLGQGESMSTGDETSCSLLLDENALIELCANTLLHLDESAKGLRVVRLDAGEAKISAPSQLGSRIEIHTPAAIATLLGTSVHVKVDPVTGETHLTCLDHEVDVKSSDPGVAGVLRCENGDQVRITEDLSPELLRRLDKDALQELAGCLVDLHVVAVSLDQDDGRSRALNDLTDGDLDPDIDVSAPEDDFDLGDPVDDLQDPTDTIEDPTQVVNGDDPGPMDPDLDPDPTPGRF